MDAYSGNTIGSVCTVTSAYCSRVRIIEALNKINNSYSAKWRWLVAIVTEAAKRRGKSPPLATDTEVNNCFSIYQNSEIIERKNDDF